MPAQHKAQAMCLSVRGSAGDALGGQGSTDNVAERGREPR